MSASVQAVKRKGSALKGSLTALNPISERIPRNLLRGGFNGNVRHSR